MEGMKCNPQYDWLFAGISNRYIPIAVRQARYEAAQASGGSATIKPNFKANSEAKVSAAQLLKKQKYRPDKVAELREQIENGTYDEERALIIAVPALLEALSA